MRPITSPLIQHNNNNNYPCLNPAGPGPLPLKCPHPALPLSSRPELGLTGLPLIRGLRAWALCSKNRHLPGGALSQAPLSCPRPADVHLSAEWGLDLGLDARRAGIGALVATLQSSEGSSRTQTQSLFLRSAQAPSPQPGGVLRGWLRSRSGGNQAQSAHPAASRARERSGRRWRKSANHTAGREKAHTRQCPPDLTRLRCHGQQGPREQSRVKPRQVVPEEYSKEQREVVPEESSKEQREEVTEEYRKEQREVVPEEYSKEQREEVTEEYRKEQREEVTEEYRKEQREEVTEEYSKEQREEVTEEYSKEQREEITEEYSKEQREEANEEQRGEVTENSRKEQREEVTEENRNEQREPTEYKEEQREEANVEQREEVTEDDCKEVQVECRDCLKEVTEEFEEPQRRPSVDLCKEFTDKPGEELGPRCDEGNELEHQHREDSSCEQKTSDAVCKSIRKVSSQICSLAKQRAQVREEPETDSKDRELLLPFSKPEDHLLKHSTTEHRFDLQTVPSEEPHNPSPTFATSSTFSKDLQKIETRGESGAAITAELLKPEHVNVTEGFINQGPDCTISIAPQGGSTCQSNSKGADPLIVSWDCTGATDKKTSSEEHCRNPTEDWSYPDCHHSEQPPDYPVRGPQRDCSLDSEREDAPEELEFGVFVQAPAAWSPESTNHTWSCTDGGGTCGGWDQSNSSWAAFPADGRDQTEDCGGQWWSHSPAEERGPSPGACQSLGSVFTAAFPSSPDQSLSEPADRAVLTLTQLLRGCVGPEDGSLDQRLLDPFHDLNRMIDRRASGVSQERLQCSLGLTPPPLGSGARPTYRRLSVGQAAAHPGPL